MSRHYRSYNTNTAYNLDAMGDKSAIAPGPFSGDFKTSVSARKPESGEEHDDSSDKSILGPDQWSGYHIKKTHQVTVEYNGESAEEVRALP
jgi:hypothetical protein